MSNFIADESIHFNHNIDDNIMLHVEKLNNTILILYFTDENNSKINIPTGIHVCEYDCKNAKYKIFLEKQTSIQMYTLYLGDSYEIQYNNIVILNIVSHTKWILHCK